MSLLLSTITTKNENVEDGPTIQTFLDEDRGTIEVMFHWPDEEEQQERSYRGRDIEDANKAAQNLVSAWVKRKIIVAANTSEADQKRIEQKLGGMSIEAYLEQCRSSRKSKLQQRAAEQEGLTAAGMMLDL